MEKNMLITYREGSFNPVTRTYDPIDVNILYDPRIKDAIIFDINRRTIYAQGLEFGNSKTFAYTYQGTQLQGTDVAQNGITFLTGIVQDVDGSISYSYSTAYTTFHTSGHAKGSTQPYVITYAYIDNNGMLHYDYRDLTTSVSDLKIQTVTLTNSTSQNVVTNISQASDGKITYNVTAINTTHSTDDGRYIASGPIDDNGLMVMTGVFLDKDGNLTYTYTDLHVDQAAQAATLSYLENFDATTSSNTSYMHSVAWMYKQNDPYNKVTFVHKDLATTSNDKAKATNHDTLATNVTLQNNTSYRFITNIAQRGDGKLSYTFSDINTYHYTTPGSYYAVGPLDDIGIALLTDVNLNVDGVLSYTYTYLHINQAAEAGTLSYLENQVIGNHIDCSYSVIWMYKNPETPYNKVTFQYKNLANRDVDAVKGSNIIISPTKRQVITDIKQAGDGKISYTYSDIDICTSTNDGSYIVVGPLDDIGIALLTDVNLNDNGVLSYSYTYLHINQSAQAGTLSYLENQVISNTVPCSYSMIWMYKNPETPYNKVTFQYKDLSNRDVDASKGSDIIISPTKRQVITNIEQAGDGKITYTYSDIDICTSTNDGSYIAVGPLDDIGIALLTDVNLNENGVLSYSYTYLHINQAAEAGTLSYLENQVIGDNVDCTYSVIWLYKNTDQPYNKVTFQYKSLANRDVDGVEDDSITLQNSTTYQVLTNIKQAGDGKISYTYAMLNTTHTYSGDNIDGPVYNVSISPNGHVSYTHENLTVNSGVYASTTYNKGVKIANAAAPTTYTQVLSSIKQDSHGKISYTYVGLYTDPVNDYKYHDLSISNEGSIEETNTNFVDVLRALSTSNSGNSTSHVVTATYTTVPTKKYVDSLLQANDALRYCGTVTPGASGTFALTHNTIDSGNNVDPGHSSPDTSRGAVYKVSAAGIIGNQRVSAGDMIISYMDDASTTTILGWDIINQNIDLRTLSSNVLNGLNGTTVLTNANLSNDGTLSYNYGSLQTTVDSECHETEFYEHSQDILNSKGAGAKVVTGIALAQNGLTTELSFTYTYLYANQGHHSNKVAIGLCGDELLVNRTNVITQVHLDKDGELSYRYSPLTVSNSPTNVTTGTATTQNNKSVNLVLNDNAPKGFRVITDVNLNQNNLKTTLSYTYTYIYSDQRHHTSNKTGSDTTGLIQGVNLSQSGDFTYAYLNLTVVDPSTSASYTITNTKPFDVITNISQAANGKITATKKTINTTHSTLDGSYVGVGPLDDLGIELLTGVNLSADGVLSYSYTYLHINQAAEAGTLSYLENQAIGNQIPCTYSVIWMYKNPETPYNKVTFQYKDLANRDVDGAKVVVDKSSESATMTLNNANKYQVLTNIRQEGDGKIAYTYAFVNTTHSTQNGSYVVTPMLQDDGVKLMTAVNLSADGVLSYSYTNLHINQAAQAGTLTYLEGVKINPTHSYSVIWMYKDSANGNKVTFSYSDLSSGTGAGTKASDIVLKTTKHQVLTNIVQTGDGKITYTYADISTTHTNTGTNTAGSSKVIGGVNLATDGSFTYSYVDIATSAYHYAVTTTPSVASKTVTIPYNGNDTTFVSYTSIVNDAKGHLVSAEKTTYTIKHEAVSQASNGSTTFAASGTSVLSGLSITNGHITKQTYTTVTDENVKVSNASSVSYLVGTSSVTSSGNQIVGLQHSANAAYMSQDGTLWTKYLYSGIAMFAGDVYAKEKLYVDKHASFNGPVTIGDGTGQDKLFIKTKAVDFNNSTAIGFDNLQALWGAL